MVLTLLVNPRFVPSSLCPDLSSFLLPAGRKHSIWIDFNTKSQSVMLYRNSSSTEDNWFSDRTRQNDLRPQKVKGLDRTAAGGGFFYANFEALWAFI